MLGDVNDEERDGRRRRATNPADDTRMIELGRGFRDDVRPYATGATYLPPSSAARGQPRQNPRGRSHDCRRTYRLQS